VAGDDPFYVCRFVCTDCNRICWPRCCFSHLQEDGVGQVMRGVGEGKIVQE
jgi:hypothetical protein